jgi:hypothetical protein
MRDNLTSSRNYVRAGRDRARVASILVAQISSIPEVSSICISYGAEGYTVWTLLKSYDREAREKVYQQELAICEMLNIYDFDFRVTSVELVAPSELVATGSIEIFGRP